MRNPGVAPYYVRFDLAGLTVDPTTPMAFQVPWPGGIDVELIQLLPGTAMLYLPTAPAVTLAFNSICTLRVYNDILCAPGRYTQSYRPSTAPVLSQQLGVGSAIPWGSSSNMALEVLTPYAGVTLGAGSFAELTLLAGAPDATRAGWSGGTANSGGPSRNANSTPQV